MTNKKKAVKAARVRKTHTYQDVTRPIAVRLKRPTLVALNQYCEKNKCSRNLAITTAVDYLMTGQTFI